MNKNFLCPFIFVSVLSLLLIVLILPTETLATDYSFQIAQIPDIDIPDIPDVEIPDVQVPQVPNVQIPQIQIPFQILQAPPLRADKQADVRVLHAVSGMNEADFYLNDILVGTLGLGEAADYILVPPGEVTLRVFTHGTEPDGTPLFESPFQVTENQFVNAVVMGNADAITLNIFDIDRSPLELGQSRVNIIHALSGGDAVSATVTAPDGNEVTLAEGLGVGENASSELPAGSYTFSIDDLLSDIPLNLNGGTTYSIFLLESNEEGQTIKTRVFSGATLPDGEAGFIRLIHVDPESPALDFYINGMLMVPNLAFGTSTAYLALEPGSYETALYGAGTDPKGEPYRSTSLDVTDGNSMTSILTHYAYASGFGLATGNILYTYSDDRSEPAEGQSRFYVFNAQTGIVDISIDGTTVIDDLDPGVISEIINLAQGVHEVSIKIVNEDEGSTNTVTLADYSISPHAANNLLTIVVR